VAEEGVAEEGVAEEEEVAEEEVAEEEVAEEEVAEEGKVAAHFYCSGSHPGEWTGRPPPGRRFSGRRRDLNLPGCEREADGHDRRARTTSAGCGNSASTDDARGTPCSHQPTVRGPRVTKRKQLEAESHSYCRYQS
jgi:hypothetical protein